MPADRPTSRVVSYPPLLLACCFWFVLAGCQDGGDGDDVFDTTALLAKYEKGRQKHDPLHFSEVDLGNYLITQRHEPNIYYIRFQLYGVISDQQKSQFDEALATHRDRTRGAVRATVQNSSLKHLSDPSLCWLKAELIAEINRALRARILRDVVFQDFSFEKG
jgi:hypothetical protein